jgi:serine/threonine-protein kinase HipA
MRVGQSGAESTLANALSETPAFGLLGNRPREIVSEICRVVDGWKAFFTGLGVRSRDLESLAQYIDGDYLLAQRQAG